MVTYKVMRGAVGSLTVFLDSVFLQEHGDEGGGGDGDERTDDAGEGSSEEEGDEDGEAHEVDARTHDAWREVGVLQVDVDEVEDEDACHLAPGVECGDTGDEDDGDDSSGNGDDVEETHEEAEEEEVAYVEDAEGDGAGDSKDEHEEALSDEPLADLAVGCLEGVVEAETLFGWEEGEEEAIGVIAFEHEVDAEEGSGENVEDVGEPLGQRGDEEAGGGGDGGFGALGDGVDAELVGEGDALGAGDDGGDALGQIFGELAEIAQDGWEPHGEEDAQYNGDSDDEDQDGDGAGGAKGAELPVGDVVDDGDEDGGEECGDVEDDELLAERPGEGEAEEDCEAEEDVAANGAAGGGFRGSWVVGSVCQRVLL
jgi:hypothetical protein